jgi:hypothetical protein
MHLAYLVINRTSTLVSSLYFCNTTSKDIDIMLYAIPTVHDRYLRAIEIKRLVYKEVLMNSAPIRIFCLISSLNCIL